MFQPEIKALVALILCCSEVVVLLFFGHRIPFAILVTIPEDVVDLCKREDKAIHHSECDQVSVSAMIKRSIVSAIDVGSNDVAQLHEHVVGSC